jgi:hypothetical protein
MRFIRQSSSPASRRYRGIAITLVVLVSSLAVAATASASVWGSKALIHNVCCGNQSIDGTRAYVTANSIAPGSSGCIAYSSEVTSLDSNRQLQVAKAKCAPNWNIDGTCSLSNNLVFIVERIPASGSPVCYAQGSASLFTADLLTVDDDNSDGSWYSYINGNIKEGQSGYTLQVAAREWAEYTNTSCSGWSGSVIFGTWQRYNHPNNLWSTVVPGDVLNEPNPVCWSVGSLSGGTFGVSH